MRVRIFDILAKGTQQDVLAAANREPDLAAALQLATDPDATTHTGAIRAALEAVSESATRDPATVVDAVLSRLVECVGDPPQDPSQHGPMRNLLHLDLGTSGQRLPVDRTERTAATWRSLLIRVPAALQASDRAIALFNLAASAADRLKEDTAAPRVGHELHDEVNAAIEAGATLIRYGRNDLTQDISRQPVPGLREALIVGPKRTATMMLSAGQVQRIGCF